MTQRATADDRWSYNGLKAIMLENSSLRAVILPTAGGKLYSLEDRVRARQWLWHNPRILPGRTCLGTMFDDHWSGGADAFFPTCYPCRVAGVSVPDAGEWWAIPWEHRIREEETCTTVTLRAGGRTFPVEYERQFVLAHEGCSLHLTFTVRNIGYEALPFVFGFHPAIAVSPGGRLVLPAGQVQVDESGGGQMGVTGQRYAWPGLPQAAGQVVDMSVVRSGGPGDYGGHFLFPETGRVQWSVLDPEGGPQLDLTASSEFTGLWLWLVYGGWRGYHHAVLEPWTSYPITLSKAIEQGTASTVDPGSEFFAEVSLTVRGQSPTGCR